MSMRLPANLMPRTAGSLALVFALSSVIALAHPDPASGVSLAMLAAAYRPAWPVACRSSAPSATSSTCPSGC
jgi:hypothetical protein